MYEVNYHEQAQVTTDISMSFVPEEFLNCESEEEVEASINSIIAGFDYGDNCKVTVQEATLTIPEEFWTQWKKLKTNGVQNN